MPCVQQDKGRIGSATSVRVRSTELHEIVSLLKVSYFPRCCHSSNSIVSVRDVVKSWAGSFSVELQAAACLLPYVRRKQVVISVTVNKVMMRTHSPAFQNKTSQTALPAKLKKTASIIWAPSLSHDWKTTFELVETVTQQSQWQPTQVQLLHILRKISLELLLHLRWGSETISESLFLRAEVEF